ncbi:MAG: hypothetical protein U0931_33480 [Vulcanimicrobiota bacterium]
MQVDLNGPKPPIQDWVKAHHYSAASRAARNAVEYIDILCASAPADNGPDDYDPAPGHVVFAEFRQRGDQFSLSGEVNRDAQGNLTKYFARAADAPKLTEYSLENTDGVSSYYSYEDDREVKVTIKPGQTAWEVDYSDYSRPST